MVGATVQPAFWRNKRVFLTGHTGFKGSWLSLWLAAMGAEVTGFALAPDTDPCIFDVAGVAAQIKKSIFGDIRQAQVLRDAVAAARPEIVIHMAAQPLVRYSYAHPVETYATNVMGTVHLLEAVRHSPGVKVAVVVTTDKCYENKERAAGYREDEPMGGYDPYSSSKGCAELVVSAYQRSYFGRETYSQHGLALASARAGNVIGGGDWSIDRLIPDAIKAFEANQPLMIRNPGATRPWQHVLEPLAGYLILAQELFDRGPAFTGGWNFGPADADALPVEAVVNLLINKWGTPASWCQDGEPQPHEAHFLKLDCTKANQQLGWYPKWDLATAIDLIVGWQRAFRDGRNMRDLTLSQIEIYQRS